MGGVLPLVLRGSLWFGSAASACAARQACSSVPAYQRPRLNPAFPATLGFIAGLPAEVLSTPFGQMIAPMLSGLEQQGQLL